MNRVGRLELLSCTDDTHTKKVLSELCHEINANWFNVTDKMNFLEEVLENNISLILFHIKQKEKDYVEVMKALQEDILSKEIPIIVISELENNDDLALQIASFPVISIFTYSNWKYQMESLLKVIVNNRRYQQNLYSDMIAIKETNYTDPLTHALNRRGCERDFEHLVGYYASNSEAFSLIILDIDHFKKVNDTYGHDVGDVILVEMASTIHNHIRKVDSLVRFGGEEFIILLSESNLAVAEHKAEEIRRQIEMTAMSPKQISITASFGVAEYNTEMTLDTMIKEADRCLYKAKEEGRNRVISSLDQ